MPYQSPESNEAVRRRPRFLSVRLFALGLIATGLGLLMLNTIGFALYLYIHLGQKDLVFGSSSGVIHLAYADAATPSDSSLLDEYFSEVNSEPDTILEIGPCELFAERSSDIRGFWKFDRSTEEDYKFVDIPVLVPILLALAVVCYTQRTATIR